MTEAQVGENGLGLSQRTYAYYESGQRMVPPEVLSVPWGTCTASVWTICSGAPTAGR